MAGSSSSHRLVLLRHAKSASPEGVPDRRRPLAGRGRRDAEVAGRWLAEQGLQPDVVWCSPADRALATWRLVAQGCGCSVEAQLHEELYTEDDAGVVRLLGTADEAVGTLLVVGHEPTTSATARRLAGAGSDPEVLREVGDGFATCGIGVLQVPGPWRDIASSAALTQYAAPRA